MWDSISIIRHHECLFLGCTGNSLGYYRYKTHLPWDDDIDLFLPKVNRKDKSVISKLEIKANSSGKEITTNKKSNLFNPSLI